jgi:hypothetical protein
MRRRLDRFERPQPLLTGLHVGKQRAANGADAPVSVEALAPRRTELTGVGIGIVIVNGIGEQRFELGAFHTGFGFV